MTEQLHVDLDALGRLLPQVEDLVGRVEARIPRQLSREEIAEGETVPSLAAAQEMSTRTLPALRQGVARQFMRMAEMIESARQGFLTSEEQPPGVANEMPFTARNHANGQTPTVV